MKAAAEVPLALRIHRALANLRFFSVSLILHCFLVALGGSYVIYEHGKKTPDFIAGGDGGLVFDGPEAHQPPVPEEPAVPKPETVNASPDSSSAMDVITAGSAQGTFQLPTSSGQISIGTIPGSAGTAGMGESLLEKIGKGGAMGKAGGTSMVKVFGKPTAVQAVVFVIDISGSMITGEKSEKTYDAMEDEIKNAIRGLKDQTMFGIVAFSADAHLYKPELVAATSSEKQRAINWLRKQSPVEMKDARDEETKKKHHGTRADRGLEEAFKLSPDTVFFVSDGEPTGAKPSDVLQQVAQWQKGRTKPIVINSIAYLADSGQKFMEDLAAKTAGSFREINPKDARNR